MFTNKDWFLNLNYNINNKKISILNLSNKLVKLVNKENNIKKKYIYCLLLYHCAYMEIILMSIIILIIL